MAEQQTTDRNIPIGVIQEAQTAAQDTVQTLCPDCWTEGCGFDPCFNICADTLDCINPSCEFISSAICCLGSPIAFPLIFLFDSDPHTNESSGWAISMLQAPSVRPLTCCVATLCIPCGQWEVRRRALNGDMGKYKLWQGYHDGPHCFAKRCPGAPLTIESGSYGEQDCPHAFLCLEVTCLGGMCSPCCAFNVSRRLMKEERGLSTDPTEARQENCANFFGQAARSCSQMACCFCCASCLLSICAPESEAAQELSGGAKNASRSCRRFATTFWRGIWSVRMVAIGCMSAQMIHEVEEKGEVVVQPPESEKMERGDGNVELKSLHQAQI